MHARFVTTLCLGLALASPANARPPSAEGRTIVGTTSELAFVVWRRFLTLGDGPRCTLEPSCSRFGAEALGRDGVAGAVLLVDRLIREPNGFAYPRGPRPGTFRDPVADHAPAVTLLSGRWCRSQRRNGALTCR